MFAITFSPDYPDREKVESFLDKWYKEETIGVNSSGSTGTPKTLFFQMEQLQASAKLTNLYFNLTADTKAALTLSIDTIAGKMMLARALSGQYTIHVTTPSARPLQHLVTPVDFIAMVPVQLEESLHHELEKLKQIRVILIGGGPISDHLVQKLNTNNLTVYHSYGMTETVSHVALRRVGAHTDLFFRGLPGVRFKTDANKLIIDAEHLRLNNLVTNDVVNLKSDTEFEWLGRADFVVNSGGYKIQMEALENKFAVYLHVPFFLWKEADEKWGERLVLCIQNVEKIDETALFDQLQLDKKERPKKTYYFSEFVYSASGKILRQNTFEQIS